ncbi:MAG: hypothetical protein Q9218_001373 [Villophora microphyllina]
MAGEAEFASELAKPSPSYQSLSKHAVEPLEINHVAEKKLVQKLDFHIIPIVMLLYLFSFLDRVNIGNARLYGMEEDLGLHGNQYQTAVSILFVTYLLSELPSNLVLKKFRPSRWISFITTAWGIIATLTGITKSYGGLIVCRLLLGLVEGGLFPVGPCAGSRQLSRGAAVYLTLFYTKRELALRIGYLFVSAAIAGAVGGLLAYAIGTLDHVSGQRGWRWILIIEGLPSFVLGIATWFLLADNPESAYYLSHDEKDLMRLRRERQAGQTESAQKFHKNDVYAGLKDWKIYAFCAGQFGTDTMLYGYSTFLPTIIKGLGKWSTAQTQALTIPCYCVGALTYVVVASLSDRQQKRGLYSVIFGAISVIGYGVLISNSSMGVHYFGCFLVAMGLYVCCGLPLAWLPSNQPRMANIDSVLQGVSILGPLNEQTRKILNKEATAFLALLHRSFNVKRKELLQRRVIRQAELDKGILPDFLPETKHIRDNDAWRGAPPAPGLVDRRVEITGPTDRKMVVNALNSNVWTYMADFEDSSAPTWDNMINGQVNLYDAIRKQVDFKQGEKEYKLRNDRTLPTLIARARGWHLEEKHLTVDGEPISGSLFDFGLYFFHNAHELVKTGTGPYFYLPKMESHLEARLWNDVFNVAQDSIGMRRGTIRGTVLIETIVAAFEMDEIIFELRDHSAGLNCGRWDYIFSVIKKFRENSNFVLPDRSAVTMTVPFMDAYVKLLIKTCHRRGVHAMGGMAAQIPIKDNKEANDAAMANVYNDKLREVRAGHDGTWVAHPALAAIASEVFNKHMPTPNQMFVRREDVNIIANDLLNMNMPGTVTEDGIRKNLNIGLGYMEGWLKGIGCVPINYLMEDAATAEVSRSQLWQWCRHGVTTAEGKRVDKAYAQKLLKEQADELASKAPKGNKYQLAAQYFAGQVTGEDYADFLTSLLYNEITAVGPAAKL